MKKDDAGLGEKLWEQLQEEADYLEAEAEKTVLPVPADAKSPREMCRELKKKIFKK